MDADKPMVETAVETPEAGILSKDTALARTTDEIVEMRRQETRRRVTYAVVATLCLTVLYIVIFVPEERTTALSAILGIAGTAAGFYYGGQSSPSGEQ